LAFEFDDEEEPDDEEPDDPLLPLPLDFEDDPPEVERDEPEPVDAVPDDEPVDEPEADFADEDRVDPCVLVNCDTSFFAPSRTLSPTSPARLIAKPLTVSTPSWTFGWFQTSSAALRICS
jgi:hypothetical protein